MKYLKTRVLSSSENKNEKGVYKADIHLEGKKKLTSGQFAETTEILTISSREKLNLGEQFLLIESEYNIQNKIYITVSQSFQKLEIVKK